MKIAEKAIYELLKGFVSNRVYGLRAPQNATAPFIIFQRVDSTPWRAINGPDGITQATLQIDFYARDYYTAKELAGDCAAILDGFRGTVNITSDSPSESIRIAGISLQNDIDILDQTDAPLLFRVSATYLVTFYTGD